MNARALAAIALKVWGAILIVGVVGSLPSTAMLGTLPAPTSEQAALFRANQIGMALNLGAQALLGAGMIALADRVVAWFIPDGLPLAIDVYASEMSALGFALVGLFVVIDGAENIASSVYSIATRPSWPTDNPEFWYVWEPQRQTIVKAFVEIACGMVLMFGRSAIANAWWALRRFGLTESDQRTLPVDRGL